MNIEVLKQQAKAKAKENKQFFDYLKKKKPAKLDTELLNIHNEIFSQTNCLACANCCITTGPLLLEKDIESISKQLRTKPGDFIKKYLKKDEDAD